MIFNSHSELAGSHAFLSASKPHWVNYDDEKLENSMVTALAAAKGTRLHNLASELITMGIKLPRTSATMNSYVNDAISYRMIPEQVLFYSPNAFGTADAIKFSKNMLRIHDLKTGVTPAKMLQLRIYTAFFCLEYGFKPGSIDVELRIYQNDDIEYENPDPDEIAHIMDRIVVFSKRIDDIRAEAQV